MSMFAFAIVIHSLDENSATNVSAVDAILETPYVCNSALRTSADRSPSL